jgi:hypothetical protein
MDVELKGSLAHAAQHAHGVQYRGEPPAPLTLEQRVSNIETLIALSSDGKTVLEQIEVMKARAAKAAEVPPTKAELAAEKKEEAAQDKRDAAQEKKDAAAEKRSH